jgi:glycosyltransferase involved in cell wall biosynthesis
MRIALDATYSVGNNLSGVAVYSREIAAALARSYPAGRFLCCYRPHRLLRSLGALPPNCGRRLLLESRAPRADVFHGLNQRLPGASLGAAVTTFHDLFVMTDEYSSPDFRRRFEGFARDAAARSDLIIAVSEFTAGEVMRLLGVPRERIRVVPHGVHLPQTVDAAREKIVLHVGAIQKRKNIVRLVRAFAAMEPGWKLVLAGSLGYAAEEALEEIAKSPRRADIELPGYVRDVSALYRRASILAFPSCAEGFGIPLLEAMAWGVPAVTSNTTALAEVAGDAALLVDPGDTDGLASALRQLGSNRELRAELIERGRKRAAQFTWSAAAERTWCVYREAIELPHRSRS